MGIDRALSRNCRLRLLAPRHRPAPANPQRNLDPAVATGDAATRARQSEPRRFLRVPRADASATAAQSRHLFSLSRSARSLPFRLEPAAGLLRTGRPDVGIRGDEAQHLRSYRPAQRRLDAERTDRPRRARSARTLVGWKVFFE